MEEIAKSVCISTKRVRGVHVQYTCTMHVELGMTKFSDICAAFTE